jgi:hypothetical protein
MNYILRLVKKTIAASILETCFWHSVEWSWLGLISIKEWKKNISLIYDFL